MVLARVASRTRSDALLLCLDILLISGAYAAVLLLRFNGLVPRHYWSKFGRFLPFIVALHLLTNASFGLYGQLWRHAGLEEARRVVFAGGAALLAIVAIGQIKHPLPASVLVFGSIVAIMGVGALRFQSRLFAFRRRGLDRPATRVAVIGAGDAGSTIIRDMMRHPSAGLVPVAIIDDDPRKWGRSLVGMRVVGPLEVLSKLVAVEAVDQALLAIPSADQSLVRRAAAVAEAAGIPLLVLPTVGDLVGGVVSLGDIRELRIEDLLGRMQVETDLADVQGFIRGKRVLITGAGGSIGAEIARQVASADPARLVLLDHDETHLYDTSATIDRPVEQVLADVRDGRLVEHIFATHQPDVVFHAAAHKHVPMLEQHPCEAIATNVVGTRNVAQAASAYSSHFVFISTDKAVRPTSVMGASKSLGERIALAAAGEESHWCAVRFGNVLGSRGSVIPTFMRQIASGGPVTVTDARMTRFFMTIKEAVQLVLQAAAMAEGGEVFMLEMGEPMRILDLAGRMIRLAGRRVGTDVEIRVTGPRPGEKLAEELQAPGEVAERTAHPSIVRLRSRRPAKPSIAADLDFLQMMARRNHAEAARAALFQLVADTTGETAHTILDIREARVGAAGAPETLQSGGRNWSPSNS